MGDHSREMTARVMYLSRVITFVMIFNKYVRFNVNTLSELSNLPKKSYYGHMDRH